MKTRFSLSMTSLTKWFGISYPTFMRWKRRVLASQLPVLKPGPHKTGTLNLKALRQSITELKHCCKRSFGAGQLIKKYQDCATRRYLAGQIKKARQYANNKTVCRVTWKHPNLVWAIDGCEVKSAGIRFCIQNLQDLCSKYKFTPLTMLHQPSGERIAHYLSKQFKEHGRPLFLKRDNAGNFNSHTVNTLLEKQMVIPLNSPCYYAPYNGAIEHAQRELKSCLDTENVKTPDELMAQITMGIHKLNHKIRRSLKGQNACQVYFNGGQQLFDKRKRKQIFD